MDQRNLILFMKLYSRDCFITLLVNNSTNKYGDQMYCVGDLQHRTTHNTTLQCTLQCTLHNTLQCTLHNTLQCTLHNRLQCTLQYTLHNTLQCTLHNTLQYTLQCTLYPNTTFINTTCELQCIYSHYTLLTITFMIIHHPISNPKYPA